MLDLENWLKKNWFLIDLQLLFPAHVLPHVQAFHVSQRRQATYTVIFHLFLESTLDGKVTIYGIKAAKYGHPALFVSQSSS